MKRTPRTQKLYDELAVGWNTWDMRSVSSFVYMPDRLQLNIAFMRPGVSEFCEEMAWAQVEAFGEHSDDGSYTDITLRYAGSQFRLESASDGTSIVVKVTPVTPRDGLYIVVQVRGVWGFRGGINSTGSNSIIADAGGHRFSIEVLSQTADISWNPSTCHNIVLPCEKPIYLRVNSTMNEAGIDEFLDSSKFAWMKRAITGEGMLGESIDAMRRSLMWNTVYDAHNNRVISPVSRNWCRSDSAFGDYVLFGWDTFFAALLFGLFNKELAYANLIGILEEAMPNGMVPNFGSGKGPSGDRSEPQVGAWCAWKLYLQHGDRWIIEECFDTLLEWNRWRFRERDFNDDGLLELGSTPFMASEDGSFWADRHRIANKQAAMYESGLDNSPMFDDAIFNDELHCLELSYAGLNGLMASDCEILAKMARLLGRNEEEKELRDRYERLSNLLNSELWDEKRGTYLNRHWNGELSNRMAPPCFYPLMAGVAPVDKAERILHEHILNPEEFWGKFVFPMISRDDESFKDQDYWRGRIWGPTNFLVCEGMRRYGWSDAVSSAAKSGLEMFYRRWSQSGVVGENYNAITGDAAEHGKASDRFYHWGALLVYIAIQECYDPQAWNDQVKTCPSPDWLGPVNNLLHKGNRISL